MQGLCGEGQTSIARQNASYRPSIATLGCMPPAMPLMPAHHLGFAAGGFARDGTNAHPA